MVSVYISCYSLCCSLPFNMSITKLVFPPMLFSKLDISLSFFKIQLKYNLLWVAFPVHLQSALEIPLCASRSSCVYLDITTLSIVVSSVRMPSTGIAGSYGSSIPSLRRRQWHPTPVLLPGKSHGQRSLVGCSPWGC